MDDLNAFEDLILLSVVEQKKLLLTGNKKIVALRRNTKLCEFKPNFPQNENAAEFMESTGMNRQQFKTLLNMLTPFLRSYSRRKAVSPEQRIYTTLYFLKHGCSMKKLSEKFGLGLETVRSLVLQTCEVIYSKLSEVYLQSKKENDWKNIADEFYEKTGLSNCIGVIDSKHIYLGAQNKTSVSQNFRKNQSIILFAVCDSNYVFSMVDFYDSDDDGKVFEKSYIGKKLQENGFNIPNRDCLPRTSIEFPCCIGDDAFPLQTNIMEQFYEANNNDILQFNSAVSSSQVYIKIAFGILTSQWRILLSTLNLSRENAKKVILAAAVLHNFLLSDANWRHDYCLDYENRKNVDSTPNSID